MPYRGAFVDHFDPRIFETLHILFGAAASGFNNTNTTSDNRIYQAGVVRRINARQER